MGPPATCNTNECTTDGGDGNKLLDIFSVSWYNSRSTTSGAGIIFEDDDHQLNFGTGNFSEINEYMTRKTFPMKLGNNNQSFFPETVDVVIMVVFLIDL